MSTKGGVFLTWVLVLLVACSSDDHSYGLRAELRGEPSIKRVWVEPNIRKVAVRSSGENYTLFDASVVFVEKDGRVYVLDAGNFTCKAFTPEGTYVATYGEGKGSAPAQVQQLSDLDVWRDSVYLVDTRRRKVSVFAKDGSFGRAEQYENPIEEIEWAEHSTRYVHRGLGVVSSVFLSIVPPSGQAVEVSPPLARDAHPIVLDGHFYTTGERAVYVPNYLPVLLTFSLDDTTGTAYPTPTFSEVPFPEAKQHGSGVRKTVSPPQNWVHGPATMLSEVLTIRQPPEVGGDSLAFDLYDTREGLEYMHSARFSLPHDYGHAQYAYARGLLVTEHDTTVRFYKVDSPTK